MQCVICGYSIVGKPPAFKKWPSGINTPICYTCLQLIKSQIILTKEKVTLNETKNLVAKFIYMFRGDLSGDSMEEENVIRVNVVAFKQKGVQNYTGAMKARDILDIWDVDRFIDDQILRGYQRQEEQGRMRQVAEYVEKCPLPVIPAILVSIRSGARFIKTDENAGILEIPRKRGAIEIIDGQHRVGGFSVIKRLVEGERIGRWRLTEEEISKYDALLDFEIPVHFIDAESAVNYLEEILTPEDKENMLKELRKEKLDHEDIERVHFFVVNKTQKAIRPSLKDTLGYLICAAGIRGIPIIEKELWRAEIATPCALDLHFKRDSPLRGMINISGAKGLGRPVQLNSFVTSLKPLAYGNEHFKGMSAEQRYNFLKTYWNVIKKLQPSAFERPGDYLILKTIGIYILNYLASDVLNWCRAKGIELPTEEDIISYLEPLKEFDFKRDSDIAAYGGQKGVREAYKYLLKFLADKGIKEAAEVYEKLARKKE